MFVFITTCTQNKIGGGKEYNSFNWQEGNAKELFIKRQKIHSLMERNLVKSSLQHPKLGPDFGISGRGGEYLPAISRYSEGSFVQGLIKAGAKFSDLGREYQLFFISALYGLVHFQEPIQNYDLDLKQSLLIMEWDGLLITKMLLKYIGKYSPRPVIINCCANRTYGNLLDWDLISSKDYIVRHAASANGFTGSQVRWTCGFLAGRDAPLVGRMVGDQNVVGESANGKVRFVKQFVVTPEDTVKIPIAVAVLRDDQIKAFEDYVRKKGWLQYLELKFIDNLRKETLMKLDSLGVRVLIVHVDQDHAKVQKQYQAESTNIKKGIPPNWVPIKILRNDYSEINLKRLIID